MQYITKKLTFFILLISIILFLLIQHFRVSYICGNLLEWECGNLLAGLRDLLLYLGFVLVPVIFTIPFKESIFEAWKRFAIWAGPLTGFLSAWVLNLPSGGGLGVGSAAGAFLSLALLTFGLYYVSSLVIIGFAWNKDRIKRNT